MVPFRRFGEARRVKNQQKWPSYKHIMVIKKSRKVKKKKRKKESLCSKNKERNYSN